jgi:hypothetical protein
VGAAADDRLRGRDRLLAIKLIVLLLIILFGAAALFFFGHRRICGLCRDATNGPMLPVVAGVAVDAAGCEQIIRVIFFPELPGDMPKSAGRSGSHHAVGNTTSVARLAQERVAFFASELSGSG